MVGFELETNALRQAVSLAFLLAAISLDSKLARLMALCTALLLHTSSWIFVPLVFLLRPVEPRSGRSKSYKLLIAVLFAVPLISVVWYFLGPGVRAQMFDRVALLGIYQDIYSVDVSRAFLVFMILPICWVFSVRWASASLQMPRDEKLAFCYSALVLAVTIAFFPMIAYRVAMTAVVLQMFLAMKAVDLSARSGAWISGGLVGHLLVYAAVSPNVRAVFNG